MAQASPEAVSERNMGNALSRHNPISTRLGSSSPAHLDSSTSSTMDLARSPSPSRSRRALTTSAAQQSQTSLPRISSVGLSSCEGSQGEYKLYSDYEDLRIEEDQRSTKDPRYIEECLEAEHSNDDSGPRRKTSTPKRPAAAQRLTSLIRASSSTREDDELKRLPEGSPESPKPKNNAQEVSSYKDDDIDDEECEFESEEDCFEQRWVPNDEDFEANVLRATGNDFALAARLIPQLYEMFEQEESSVVGFWDTGYRKYAGNSSGYASGTSGGGFHQFGGYTGQSTNSKKRQKGNDEDNGEGSSNNQDEGRNGDGGNAEGSAAGGSNTPPLACPFNKKDPSKYNGSHKQPNGKRGVYKSCSLGFPDYQRLREHLLRVHRWVQCENCAILITAAQDDRHLAYQTHRSNLAGCENNPQVVREGITELQWAQIDKFQKKSRFEATSRKAQLNVVKWNNIWEVLFPDHEGDPPHPWYDAKINTMEQPSFLDINEEVKQFEELYATDTMGLFTLLEMHHAVATFQRWFVKRLLEHWERPVVQQTQQQISQVTIGEYPETKSAYSSREEVQLNPLFPLPIGTPTRGRAGIGKSSSHQEPLQQHSNAQDTQSLPSHTQRNVTDPVPGYQTSGYMAVAPYPGTTPGRPDSSRLPMHSQQNQYQPQYNNPSIMSACDGQLSNSYSESPGLAQGYGNVVSMDYGAPIGLSSQPVDYTPYGSHSTEHDINGAFQSQQTNPDSLPHRHNPTRFRPSSGTSSVQLLEAHGPNPATEYNWKPAHPPQQSPQGTLPHPKLHPQRSYPNPDEAKKPR